jgi:type VI protein secretion system component Hcp
MESSMSTSTSGRTVGHIVFSQKVTAVNKVNLINRCDFVRFQVLTVASMKFTVFWDVAITLMMEAVCASETSVNIILTTGRYIPKDSKLQV